MDTSGAIYKGKKVHIQQRSKGQGHSTLHAVSLLSPGPPIADIQIERCDERSILIINGRLLQVSATEYAMLLRLLEHAAHGSFVLFEELVSCLKLSSAQPPTHRALRQMIYKHISSLRAILWLCGMDITSVRGHGYLLVRVADEET